MEITYFGHSCFKVKGSNVTVVFDPFDPKIGLKKLTEVCDVVCVSHQHFDHNYLPAVKDYKLVVEHPGEYEYGGAFITGYLSFHDAEQGTKRGKNTLFCLDIDGFSIMHLGDLGHTLPKDVLEDIPAVDILMIPVGGTYTIDAETAVEVISQLEPAIVIPMHYQTEKLALGEPLASVEKFVHEMGVEAKKLDGKLKVSKRSEIPQETEIIILKAS